MRQHFLSLIGTAFALTALPLLPALLIRPVASPLSPVAEPPSPGADAPSLSTSPPGNVENDAPADAVCYRILNTTTGEIEDLPLREYLIGAVAAEMPASFEPEALKAQAVAAHTYAERQCLVAAHHPELGGADFSDDPSLYQACLTAAEQQERWGKDYEANRRRIAEAVDAVQGELLLYEDTPIIAAFHAMSSGRTESAANVWGSEIAYLRPVDSSSDCDAPEFAHMTAFSAEEVAERLTAAHAGLVLGAEPEGWFGEPEVSEAKTVLVQRAGDGLFTGQELRSIFGLRSAAFTVDYANETFAFTTYGSGHDVGMSQYGANAMAQMGYGYREILLYYYPGVECVG